MRIARRYIIHGRVQGVGFRFFTLELARREGLHGWVQNMPDGGVEVEAEGDAEALERFELRLRSGPRGARIDEVIGSVIDPGGNDSGFDIR